MADRVTEEELQDLERRLLDEEWSIDNVRALTNAIGLASPEDGRRVLEGVLDMLRKSRFVKSDA